eukprot:137889-Rhodomonas_salina.2
MVSGLWVQAAPSISSTASAWKRRRRRNRRRRGRSRSRSRRSRSRGRIMGGSRSRQREVWGRLVGIEREGGGEDGRKGEKGRKGGREEGRGRRGGRSRERRHVSHRRRRYGGDMPLSDLSNVPVTAPRVPSNASHRPERGKSSVSFGQIAQRIRKT